MTEPGEKTVCDWLNEDRDRSYIDAARHFFPGVSDEQHEVLARKYSRWWKRWTRRQGIDPKRTARKSPQTKGSARGAPRYDLADLEPHERYREQLAELGADLDVARAQGNAVGIAQLNKQFTEVGERLDAARDRAARMGRGIERTPAGLQRAIADRQDLLAALAELTRRNNQRAEQQADQGERQTKRGKRL